ncbi:lycopene cyclase domain-containing protein [Corynebacterium yudongzhengii]|uniref:Lycopene cyclase domain-containing protein n=1 Tax=Corynebacterium yudongzhengii TaxID=2080740 RepID=A0A2U1T659_9CORY|nr:lycopene cyclase domain-containing protein [Corynebacterium yudongzhengii]AWB82007.1 lycopene cyclase domain-containing protein [Corynebacterium yudongzhengii]PWC01469.1 lycopene cyclase domain-containing protein [Corynebacterium yudongzhengii]
MTYLVISLPFLLVAALVWLRRRRAYPRQGRITLAVLAVVLVLTIIFDNLMIYFGNVDYGEEQNLGISLGLVPIEDLFYPIFATLIIAAFWPPKKEA